MNVESTTSFVKINIGALARDCAAWDTGSRSRRFFALSELVRLCGEGTRMSDMEARELALTMIRMECVRKVAQEA